jgi:galactose mutarotase-like enzyme
MCGFRGKELHMITISKFKNCDCVILENDFLKITLIPKLGGKIASFIEKNSGFELLFQDNAASYRDLTAYDDFDVAAWGFDDAFPCIEKGDVPYGSRTVVYPDHGEVWTLPFTYEIDGEVLRLSCVSRFLPYRYNKTLTLDGRTLNIRYHIENTGGLPIPFIWTMHCLINCANNMELRFPKGVEEVEVAIPGSGYLGEMGTIHRFPVTADGYRLDRIFDKSAGKKEKYYGTKPVQEGVCAAFYPDAGVTFTTYFDPKKLPCLGFWVTEGGYKGDYNCALEPTSGYYDFICKAERSGTLRYLNEGEPFSFDIAMRLEG